MSFETLGYFKDYYIDSKYIGSVNCEKDRDVIGYSGFKYETLKEDLIFKNKKKIKKGTKVRTMIYPLNGKML